MVRDYEETATAARARMVDQLRANGVSARTLAAFDSVPRHRLVPHFWSIPMTIGTRRTRTIEHREGDPTGLALLHDIERAHAINQVAGAVGDTTSTASAPRLLAAQADLLDLHAGMTVLEIGTGPGYFAAILSLLVGPEGRVYTVDIDGDVAALAAERLDALGYTNVTVLARDGHLGAPEPAPFDRVVGSVGCNDIAAAWLDQLRSDGFALIPLRHGCFHPMLRVEPDGRARIVTRSGYVAIQGVQSDTTLWPYANASARATARAPLPGELAAALAAPAELLRIGARTEWDLAYWIAITDQRAGAMAELNDGAGSSARIDTRAGAIRRGGPAGAALATELLDHAAAWLRAGRPRGEDYEQRFVPLGAADAGAGWVIHRVDHDQVLTLV